jgi:peptidoglycan hydrolase-like protein with peptidoglycan-binding domain
MIGNVNTAPASKAAMVDGELLLVGPDMETIAAAGDEYFYVVQRLATGFKYSNKIQSRNVIKYEGSAYLAATEQESYIGYDGSTGGSIILNDETEYSAHIIFKHDKDIWSERQHKKTQHYTTGGVSGAPTTATQVEVADALAQQFASEAEVADLARVSVVMDEAGDPVAGAATSLIYTEGSTRVVADANGAGGITNLVVGDYLRVSANEFDSAYLIEQVIQGTASTPETVILAQPFQEVDTTVAIASNAFIDAATAAAANCGIKIVGRPQTLNTLDFYEQVNFELAIDGGFRIGGQTQLAENGAGNSVSPDQGSGTYEKVFDLENKAQGYEGITNRVGFPIPNFPVYALPASQYDVYLVSHNDVHGSSSLNRDIASPMDTMICVNQVGADTATSAIEDALDTMIPDLASPEIAP